ncbi:MAG: hypothetical protein WC966_03750 [Bradymonadales bacterium]|jgi:hypothetical protein
MKRIVLLLLSLAFCVTPSLASAQSYVVAIFAPSIDFKDGAERNEYVSKVAAAFSRATGLSWNGQAFARASDFESARANVDVVIVDSDYYISKLSGLTPLAMLSGSSGVSRRMHLIAKKGASDKLYNYRGKRLVLVSGSGQNKKFLEATALANEASLGSYFGSVDEARDVRSALNAVELGKADLTLAYDGYASGFTNVYTSPSVGLPVIALSSSRISGATLEKLKSAAKGLGISASSIISSSSAYSAGEAANMRNASSSQKTTMSYALMDTQTTRVQVYSTPLLPKRNPLTLNPAMVYTGPTLNSLDKKLDRKL